jgi:hypothetical protein
MAEVDQYTFLYSEIVEALVRKQGLHDGVWQLRIEFGLSAANIKQVEGSKDATPAAIVPVVKIGIQRGSELNNLSVDAAVVNPKPERSATKAALATARKSHTTTQAKKKY